MDHSRSSSRLLGVDAARLLAILGMFAAHVFPLSTTTAEQAYSPTITGAVASGRASALFMVLAGVSLVLLTNSLERKGFPNPKVYSVLLRRALIIAVLGLLIGPANEAIANILVHYGILFLLLSLILRAPRATLWVVSTLWLAITPIIWQLLSVQWTGQRLNHNPSFADLLDPGLLLKDIFVTGYYPLLVWIGYGLLGMAIGKTNLSAIKPALYLGVGGLLAAAASFLGGIALITPHLENLANTAGVPLSDIWTLVITGHVPGHNIGPLLLDPVYQWLPTAHSQSLISTIHTAAFAASVIGLMQLTVPRMGMVGQFIAASGRAPLTLYVGHVLLLPLVIGILSPTSTWWVLCAATALLGAWILLNSTPGPLESLVRTLTGADDQQGHRKDTST
ncbi:hypothetical protein AUR04nite_21350 [Glutamicibacter uratoxydans]|uniref:Heparan-alpha-glucosaminide N-acetyltransferase catalytic domain-containing protein n=1 Tax=Glutamicibacter uratoxydans TaxID=43667 RepID=A0A4Y4DPQ6_GLUUR|nr:heparan-alpha-glucosaminide N-acetyltransferase domain-containing protein [Glutamicibacter uratoxydans]GED06603.1 hypothetical protein AUR04nite_21350 [Glutamicibacter uratoxydans]